MNLLFDWLNNADPSIKYLFFRDILHYDKTLQDRVQDEILIRGWGHDLSLYQKQDGYWEGYYSPKWISTHYSLQTLMCFNYPKTDAIQFAVNRILMEEKCKDSGISPSVTHNESDCERVFMGLTPKKLINTDCIGR